MWSGTDWVENEAGIVDENVKGFRRPSPKTKDVWFRLAPILNSSVTNGKGKRTHCAGCDAVVVAHFGHLYDPRARANDDF